MFTIYKLESPEGKVYIGCTCQSLKHRFGRDGEGYWGQPYIWPAIQKFGWNSFKHEVITTTESREEASALERRYIQEYDSMNLEKGYNSKPGGIGSPLPPVPPEVGRKISEGRTGRRWMHKDGRYCQPKLEDVDRMQSEGWVLGGPPIPDDQKLAVSNANKGRVSVRKDGKVRHVRPEEVETMLADGWEYGSYAMSEAQKQRLREVNLGKQPSPEAIAKIVAANTGKVVLHKGDAEYRVVPEKVEELLAQGYEMGRPSKTVQRLRETQLGRRQSEETKAKRSASMMGKLVGRKQIHKGTARKCVPQDQLAAYLADGWELGIKSKGGN